MQRLEGKLADACGGWVTQVTAWPAAVVAVVVMITALLAWQGLERLGLDSDEASLFRPDVSYRQPREALTRAFPAVVDPVVIVIEGESEDLAHQATERMRERLLREPARFPSVYQPGGGPFFERHGLLYLDVAELDEVVVHLIQVQPYLGELAADPTLRGLFEMLGRAAEAAQTGELERSDIERSMAAVSEVVHAYGADSPRTLAWAEVLLDREPSAEARRRFLLIQPVLDFSRVRPAEVTLTGLREVVGELGLDAQPGVRVRITGSYPLSYEEADHVGWQSAAAGAASFILVSLVLILGLRSLRGVVAILVTLVAGLAWTGGFAALAIGRLNLISITFTVLFIGLSVDFGIHLVVAYREAMAGGRTRRDSLVQAAREVGPSLCLCCATTATAFYAFVPSDFLGVSELGMIAGTGMFISLFTNLTLLPALLMLGPEPARPKAPGPLPRAWSALLALPQRATRTVLGVAAALALAGGFLMPRVEFDLNPLRVRDPSTESVQTYDELLRDGMAFPWNVEALEPSIAAADALARRLEALPEVDRAVTVSDWVPEDQEEKLALIEDAAFLLLPTLDAVPRKPAPEATETVDALRGLIDALAAAPVLGDVGESLRDGLVALAAALDRTPEAERGAALGALESRLLGTLDERLRLLSASLRTAGFTLADLPPELRSRAIADDGTVRVEVFPSEDLNDNDALERYVLAVSALAPGSYGEGIVIYESGRVVVRSFRNALIAAALLIFALLIVLWRNLRDAVLVALPLALAALLTAAASVALNRPFNFANVIVIPLLLGMGVDSGIHLVHRHRQGGGAANLLRTGTARAVLLSALTTVASFGTLGFSSHRGLASLGQLLTLGLGLMVMANLVLLPALVARERRRGGESSYPV